MNSDLKQASAPPATGGPPNFAETPVGRFRWTVCALLFFATTVNYMDRQILGLLAPTFTKTFGWSESHYGYIVTTFQFAYALGLVGFGRLIDLVGTKRGYTLAIVFWSLSAMSHALNAFISPTAKLTLPFGGSTDAATATTLPLTVLGFAVCRFALGLGESGNFPAAVKVVAEWFPKKERSFATGLFNCGANIGAMIAPLLVPWLTSNFGGWPAAFLILGALDLIWLAFWLRLYNSPEASKRVGAPELAYIQSDREVPVKDKIPWRGLLRFRQTWAYSAQSFIISPVWWFYLFWLPKFLNTQYGLDIKAAGAPLVAIYTATTIGSIGGGYLSSSLLRKGWSVNASRKTALLICGCCTLPVMFATRVHNMWLAAAMFALAASAHQGWAANVYTTVSDMFPKKAVGSVIGFGGMCGSVSAMVFSFTAGRILERTGKYDELLIACGGAYLLALLAFHLLAPRMTPARIE